jgi:RTX calcium-binding nonapeptide repeat (4 copies)
MRRIAIAVLATGLVAGIASAATLKGTNGRDRLIGTQQADSIDGRAGNDTLRGLGGNDAVKGGAGKDTIDAGPGDDRIAANGDNARDTVRCGSGRDIATVDTTDVAAADCEVVSRQISVDGTTASIGQHSTEVEPDSFAFGSTVVSVFQIGRVFEGGAVAIGFSTSRDGGKTWRSGVLPGVTRGSPQPGVDDRASDPAVTYDAVHRVWLAVTLGISPETHEFHFYINRSADGLTWGAPLAAVTAPEGDLDKEWIACDNGATSPFRGHCYIAYYDVATGAIRTTASADGGATWGPRVATSPIPPNGLDFNGTQPVTLPDGTLVVIYTTFASNPAFSSGVVAARSTDGGATFAAPVSIGPLAMASIPAVRTFSLASAEADSKGRIYAAWEGCASIGPCSASRILLSTSTDGLTWTPPVAITSAAQAVDHFLPGLGADPSTPGRLSLVYHSIPDTCASRLSCHGIDVLTKTSSNGGRTWTNAQRLTAETMALDWLPRTRSGLMLGDYVSTSFSLGHPVSVFAVAAARVGATFRQAIFAYRAAG